MSRYPFRVVLLVFRRFFNAIFSTVFKKVKPDIVISYDSQQVRDGFGAQFQRILSIISLGEMYGFRILRPSISEIAIHPLDKFKSESEMFRYLSEQNSKIFTSNLFSDKDSPLDNCYRLRSFTIIGLLKFSFFYIRCSVSKSSQPVGLLLSDAHSIADLSPDFYSLICRKYFGHLLTDVPNAEFDSREIVIHYRRGPGGFAIFPGQNISRELSLAYFLLQLERILHKDRVSLNSVTIFTDAPKYDVDFRPPNSQLDMWNGSPGFNGDTMKIRGAGLEEQFDSIAKQYGIKVVIDRNLDPMSIIMRMSRAKYLVMSRSSLSYVGGIFNQVGEVYYPPDFWHPKLSTWTAPE